MIYEFEVGTRVACDFALERAVLSRLHEIGTRFQIHVEIEPGGGVARAFGVDFKNPNFAKVAEAMGAKGIRLEEPGDVKDAFAEALAYNDGPIVVDAVADRFALSLPSHVPFHTAKGFTLSMAKQLLSGRMDTVIKSADQGKSFKNDILQGIPKGPTCFHRHAGNKCLSRRVCPSVSPLEEIS